MRFPVAGLCLFTLLPAAAHAQTTVEVWVGWNGDTAAPGLRFFDVASGTTSQGGTQPVPAVTRIHDGDSVRFVWKGDNHDVTPFEAEHDTNHQATFSSSQLKGFAWNGAERTGWNSTERYAGYFCRRHGGASSSMTGRVYIYEVAQRFGVTASRSTVGAGQPFTITVTALGASRTDEIYGGTVQLSSSDASAVLPGSYAFDPATDVGTQEFPVVLRTGGPGAGTPQTITVSDGGSVTGTVTVNVQSCTPGTHRLGSSTAIRVPAPGSTAGRAQPYPSTVSVSGLVGTVANVSVLLAGVTHQRPRDIDMLLVGPQGQKMIVFSDPSVTALARLAKGVVPGGLPPSPTPSPVNLILSDRPASVARPPAPAPPIVASKPFNYETPDLFKPQQMPYASAPPVGSATLASVFRGTDPNGTWSLYVLDDQAGYSGAIARGWGLLIETACP